MKKLSLFLILSFLVSGCGFIRPSTHISVNPLTRTVSVSNTKDVNIDLEEASFNPETKTLTVRGLVISDLASPVITANVEQLRMINEQIEIHGRNIDMALARVEGMVNILGPLLSASSDSGGGGTSWLTPEMIAAILAKLQPPTTVPVPQPSP